MKTIAILFTLFYFLNALAVAPYGIKGQNQSVTYPNVYQYPNYSVTGLGGINALIETGNKNILENPSFEAPFFGSAPPSWTSLGMTFNTSALPLSGQKAVRVSMSSSAMAFAQDSGVSQAAFAGGIQCLAMVYVKTTVSGIFVSSRQNSVTSTTNRVAVNNDGKYGLYKVPFICGSGSNGISIHSNGVTVTGDVDVDDSFVGAVDLKQDVNNIGNWTTYTPTISSSSGSITNYTQAFKWRQVGEEIEVSGTMTFSAASAAFSDILVTLPNGYTMTTAGATNQSLGYGVSFDAGVSYYPFSVFVNTTSRIIIYPNAVSVHTGIAPVSASSITNIFPFTLNTADSINFNFSVPVTQFSGATSVYTSTNANYSPRAFTPTVTYGTGGATNVVWTGTESRNGNKLIVDIKGAFTGLSGAFTIPKFTVPNNLVADTSSMLIGANGFKVVGYGSVEDAGIANYQLYATAFSGTQITVDLFNAAGTYSTNSNITNTIPTTFNNLDTITLHYEVPIIGWENSNIIIGSFLDLNYVAARGVQSSGQSIANTGFLVTVTYDSSKTYDTHNALNTTTGVFTAPMAGYYKVETSIMFNSAAWALNYAECVLVKNSASYSTMGYIPIMAAGTYFIPVKGADTVYLAKNDTLSLGAAHTRTAGAANLILSGVYNYFSITRVPGQ